MILLFALAVAANADPAAAVAISRLSDDQLCAGLNNSAAKAVAEHHGPAQIGQMRADCKSKTLRVLARVPVNGEDADAYLKTVSAAAQGQICARKAPVIAEFLRRGWGYEYDVTFADGSKRVLPIRC